LLRTSRSSHYAEVSVFRTETSARPRVSSMLLRPRRLRAAHLIMRYPDSPATDRSIPAVTTIGAAMPGFGAT